MWKRKPRKPRPIRHVFTTFDDVAPHRLATAPCVLCGRLVFDHLPPEEPADR